MIFNILVMFFKDYIMTIYICVHVHDNYTISDDYVMCVFKGCQRFVDFLAIKSVESYLPGHLPKHKSVVRRLYNPFIRNHL